MRFTPKQLATAYPDRSKADLKNFKLVEKLVNDNLNFLLNNPKISCEKKAKLIEVLLKNSISDNLINFLKYLIISKQLIFWPEIVKEYQKILAREKVVIDGELILNQAINPAELAKVEERLSRKFQTTVKLKVTVKPEILGGAILKIADKTVDNSWSKRLQTLK